ncbi:hypothetical protein PsYK624_032860 [Phanerochaete sordida]|uniref:Uncharacterized protein n=1 Tax=Phanerochaete sordida TaxID=48140 RepID=A0A9P3G2R8_9APHY|nr:hypothetical protein PsYK624_032860 [Phanerochaete sordida]
MFLPPTIVADPRHAAPPGVVPTNHRHSYRSQMVVENEDRRRRVNLQRRRHAITDSIPASLPVQPASQSNSLSQDVSPTSQERYTEEAIPS